MINKKLIFLISGIVLFLCSYFVFILYDQYRTEQRLITFQQNPNIWVHRVNSIDKLKVLTPLKANIEVDIILSNSGNNFNILVGHDLGDPKNFSFIDYLDVLEQNSSTKIWLDIKNINSSNLNNFISKFEELIALKKLSKNQFILETTNINMVSPLKNKGYLTTFYIWISDLESLSESDKEVKIKTLLPSIIKNNINQISFDYKLIQAATNIIPKSVPNVKFNSWNTNKTFNKDLDYAQSQFSNPFISIFLIKFNE